MMIPFMIVVMGSRLQAKYEMSTRMRVCLPKWDTGNNLKNGKNVS